MKYDYRLKEGSQEKSLKMSSTALLLVFTIIVGLLYPMIGAIPVYSYTGDSMPIYIGGDNDNFTQNKNDNDYFEVSAIYQDSNTIYNSRDNQQPDVSLEDNPASLSFNLEFYLTQLAETLKNCTTSNGYSSPHFVVATTFGTNLNIPDTFREGALTDSEYTLVTDEDAGRYEIDANGNIKIYLTDKYIAYVTGADGKGDVLGTLTFDGQLKRAETEDGDQTFEIGTQEVTIKFKDQYPTITKTAEVNKDSGTVTWTIVINNTGKIDLDGYTLTDDLMPDTLTVTPELSYTRSGNTLIFSSGQTAQKYTITYTTPITPELLKAGQQKNDATLKKTGDDNSKSDDGDIAYFTNPYYVSKSGTADYQAAGNKYENKINWTITVKSNYGTSLNGYKILDKLNEATVDLSTATVSPSGSIDSNGVYSGDASEITINYVQENAQGGTKYVNKVEVKTPTNDPVDSKEGEVTYKKDSDFFNFTKTSNVDQDKHTITWTININATDGRTLAGYELTDIQFPSAITDLNITSYKAMYSDVAESNRTMTLSNGKIAFGSGETATNVSFTYTTEFDPPVNNGSSEITTDIPNPISDNKEHSTTATATVKSRNTVTKASNSGSSDQKASSAEITKILSWTADIIRDGKLNTLTYQDTLSVTGENATHTITDAQLSALKVLAKVGQYDGATTLTAGTDYTVERDGTGFKVVFKDTVDTAGYNYFTITYDTTAVMPAVTDSSKYPYQYSFGNKGTFGGNDTGVIGYGFTRNNPEVYDTLDLHVNKNWQNEQNIPTSDRISSVPVAVFYKTNKDGTWRNVKVGSNGEYLYYGDAGYASGSATVLTITAGDSNAWASTAEGLLKAVAKADANGDQEPITYYYYKVEEIEPDGTNDNYIKTGNGYYTVSNGADYGVSDDNSYITITNSYFKNIDLNAKKNWQGSDGSGNGIDSVYIYLQYSVDNGNNWASVNGSAGNYLFADDDGYAAANPISAEINGDDWEYQFTNLPVRVLANGSLANVIYRYKEYGYKKTGSSEITQIDTGSDQSFIVDNGYYKVSYSASYSSQDETYDPRRGNGALEVENVFHKTEDLAITINKQWNNDAGRNVQPKAIKVAVQQQVSGTAVWTTVEEKILTRNDDGSWDTLTFSGANYPSQVIDGEGNITEYAYRAQEIGYLMDGTEWVELALNTTQFATGTRGYYVINYQNNSITEGETNRTITINNNYNPVETMEITPQKIWKGDEEHLTERPESVTFTLQRRIGTDGEWEDYEYATGKSTVELSASTAAVSSETGSDSTIWTVSKITGLPQKLVTVNDGVTTVQDCYYRLVETKYGDTDIPVDDTSFNTDNGTYNINADGETNSTSTFNITNSYSENIGITKTIIDSQGNKISTIEKSDLENYKKTIDGDEYYVFNWYITYDGSKSELIRPVSDTLPKGFELCYKPDQASGNTWWGDTETTLESHLTGTTTNPSPFEGYFEHPIMVYPGSGGNYLARVDDVETIWARWESTDSFYYDKSANRVYFTKPALYSQDQKLYVGYATKIKCEDLEALIGNKKSYSITNHAIKHERDGTETDKTAEATLKITQPVVTDLIGKSYSPNEKLPGYVNYTVDVNPEGMNLSSGDTIDITDIFHTVKYYDHKHNGGEWTEGDDLVDVLMSKIKLYKVDANGVKTELSTNQYTMQFESNASTEEGAALIKLVVPDETHISIEYTYKIVANENTPSVKNGSLSSTMVNGRYVTMKPGLIPPTGDKIVFYNEAKLEADSADGYKRTDSTEYSISRSSGTISTTKLPMIKKVNVGDYTVKSLDSQFYLAKYEDGKWYYATSHQSSGEINWSTKGMNGTMIDGDAFIIYVDSEHADRYALDEGTLYKLVEIKVPEGYEGSNLDLTDEQFKELIVNFLNEGTTFYDGTDYSKFLNKFVNGFYFTINSNLPQSELPSDLNTSDVISVTAGTDIEVPDNELIDLSVNKHWVQDTGADSTKINVALYWSYTKDTSGMPADAIKATAEDLGIIDPDFSAEKLIEVSGDPVKAWENLPSGSSIHYENGVAVKGNKIEPIYYYIQENQYYIGTTGYNYINEALGYMSAAKQPGLYMPIYYGNAANSDTTVKIENSKKLLLEKEWKDSSGKTMTNIPVKSILVSIYGVDEDGVETEQPLFKNVSLTAADNWQADITELIGEENLSQYKSFVAKEEGTQLSNYTISCVFNLNANVGKITVTNKNTDVTEAAVTAEKQWSDGADAHKNDSVTVQLYRSTTNITGDNLKNLTLAKLKQLGDNVSLVGEAQVLNADNEWSYNWTGLDLQTSSKQRYYYYILETSADIQKDADKYAVSYSADASVLGLTQYTISNTRDSLTIQKKWQDADGAPITDVVDQDGEIVTDNTSKLPEIYINIKKDSVTVPETIKVVALGDSITDGYQELSKNSQCYPSQLTKLLTDNGYTLADDSVLNLGVSGEQIPAIKNRVSQVPTDADIVCLLGGTNDIHQGGGVRGDVAEIYTRMCELIEAVHTQAPNAVILVGSIPKFDFTKPDGSVTEAGSWWYNYYNEIDLASLSSENNGQIAKLNYGDVNDSTYTNYYKNLPNVYEYVKFVDVCAAVDPSTETDLRADGCHPNATGYTHIANAYYTAIGKLYTTTEDTGETITLNKANNWTYEYDIPAGDTSEYKITELNVPTGWEVIYPNQSGTAADNQPLVVVNKKQKQLTEISVEKTWVGDTPTDAGRNGIFFTLYRSSHTDADGNVTANPELWSWEPVDVDMPTPTKTDTVWTFTYSALDKYDLNDNLYYYRIEEQPLEGYETAYGTENTNGLATGALTLTNNRKAQISVEKDFVGVPSTAGYTVKVKIHRTAVPDEDDSDRNKQDLILVIPETADVSVGDTKTITANKNIELVSVSQDGDYADVTASGDTVTVVGKNKGQVTVVVTDGTDEKTITIDVTDNLVVSNGNDALANSSTIKLIAGGESITLNTNKENVTVSPETSDSISITSGTDGSGNAKFTVKPNAAGSTTLTFSNSDKEGDTFTVTIEVLDKQTISSSATSVVEGGVVTLTPTTGITYEVISGTATIQGNKLIATNTGAVKVKGKYTEDGIGEIETNEVTITVNPFSVSGDNEVTIGSTLQLSSNAPSGATVTWTSSDSSNKITVNSSGLVSASDTLEGGEKATITATFTDDAGVVHTATKEVTAKDDSGKFKMTPNPVTVKVGNTVEVSCNQSINGFWGTNDSIATVVKDGNKLKITGVSSGSVTITVQDGVNYGSNPLTINVIEGLVVTPNPANLKVGGSSVTLSSNMAGTTYSLTSNTDNAITFDAETGEITPVAVGAATIHAVCGDEETDVTVNVSEASSEIELTKSGYTHTIGTTVSSITISIGDFKNAYGGGFNVYFNNSSTLADYIYYNNGSPSPTTIWGWVPPQEGITASVSGKNITFTFSPSMEIQTMKLEPDGDFGEATWIIENISYVAVTQNTSNALSAKLGYGLSLTSALNTITQVQQAPSNAIVRTLSTGTSVYVPTFENDGYIIVELSDTEGWLQTIPDLEVYDGNGAQYYYWAEEYEVKYNGVNVTNGFNVSYSYIDGRNDAKIYSISAANPGAGHITIRNTKVEDESVELPEFGSTGTKIYTTLGSILLLLSAAGYVTAKRRRWSDG